MSRPVRLHQSALPGQFRDDAGRPWTRDDDSKPRVGATDRPWFRGYARPFCTVCGADLGVVVYFTQPGGPLACEACVEVVSDQNAKAVSGEERRRIAMASEEG